MGFQKHPNISSPFPIRSAFPRHLMSEEDNSPPSSSSRSSSSPPPPLPLTTVHPPNPNPNSVTLATPPPLHQTLTLALPIQSPPPSSEFWSEGATSALIDAWGDHFLQLGRGNVTRNHWQRIAELVSGRSEPPRSGAQCKNRVDTLKKRYKAEKSKAAASSWVFFDRLDFLLAPTVKTPAFAPHPKKQRTFVPKKRKGADFESTLPAYASSASDSLPPDDGVEGMGEVTRAIVRFGEVYERVERSKMRQAVEMEKQRMGFCREIEMQRMEFFMKIQMELSRIGGGGGGSNGRRRWRHLAGKGNGHGTNGMVG